MIIRRFSLASVGIALVLLLVSSANAQNSSAGPSRYDNPTLPEWTLNADLGQGGSPTQAAVEQTAAPGPAVDQPPPRYDVELHNNEIQPASFTSEQPATPRSLPEPTPDPRRLAPRREIDSHRSATADRASPSDLLSSLSLRAESVYSTIGALAFVLGMFFFGTWTLRRGGRNKTTALPATVVSALGRVTLAPKHVAELLRVGNKLVLVSLTPEGPKPITEVTDPVEVDRLTGMCRQLDSKSSSREFEQMFRELATERPTDGYLDDETPMISVPTDLAAFRSRGGGRRG